MPERCSRCGEPIGPDEISTSRLQYTWWVWPPWSYMTPTARLPSRMTWRVIAWVITVRFGRPMAGRR
ncbi:hypothetical protein D3C76_927480 [compost metagenome]